MRAEAGRPASEHRPDGTSPKPSADPRERPPAKRRGEKESPFSTAGRELTDDELNRIVGGL
jgi:bacteriocin-like protein